MNKNTTLLLISLVLLSFTLTACTKYVCYDGTTEKDSKNCPILEIAEVSEDDAGKYADNYGIAVADAKHDSYTRVNLYEKDATWYSNVLFTNSDTEEIHNVLLKIDGKTGDVSCETGCEYFSNTASETVSDITQTE